MQEEYNDEDDIGVLDCGHGFHSECIKQWLMYKNLCPICKTTGLKTEGDLSYDSQAFCSISKDEESRHKQSPWKLSG